MAESHTGDDSEEPDDTAPDDLTDAEVGGGLLDADMGPSSALAHLYRGEIHRMTFWRERLDRTTNWAVIVLAAVLTWAFSAPSNPHYVLLGGTAVLALFLVVEARRYRGYDLWRGRVRMLQRNVWALGLDPDGRGRAPLAGAPRRRLPRADAQDHDRGGTRPPAPANLPPVAHRAPRGVGGASHGLRHAVLARECSHRQYSRRCSHGRRRRHLRCRRRSRVLAAHLARTR